MSVEKRFFDVSDGGDRVSEFTVTLADGQSASFLDFGATLRRIRVKDQNGLIGDVSLAYDHTATYERPGSGCIGGCIGRVGNRIGGSAFTLNGKKYTMEPNEKANNLHSGPKGYHLRMWEGAADGDNAVVFTLRSPDGDSGFPGNADVKVRYSLENRDGATALRIEYNAVSDADTLFNMTNHAYFNLKGAGDMLDHTLRVNADQVTATDDGLIPTGEYTPVADCGADFRTARPIGDAIAKKADYHMLANANGLDCNFVLNGWDGSLREAAEVCCAATGRRMRVYTDQPGIQVYTGQGLNNTGLGGAQYSAYSGVALETQHFPDSVNHPNFPTTLVKAGETYHTVTEYVFDTL